MVYFSGMDLRVKEGSRARLPRVVLLLDCGGSVGHPDSGADSKTVDLPISKSIDQPSPLLWTGLRDPTVYDHHLRPR